MAYYYLMAQLPHLYYEQKPPMSSEDFKALAKPLLNKSDFDLLNQITLEPQDEVTGCNFIDGWRKWDRALRSDLAKQRAIKLKREIPQGITVTQMDAAAAASKASDESSPLDGEILLDKARWLAIDDIAGSDYFHRNSVFAYFLKLLLIERRLSFNAEKGFTEYKLLYASIVESVQNAGDPK